jgi:hypothetical protein
MSRSLRLELLRQRPLKPQNSTSPSRISHQECRPTAVFSLGGPDHNKARRRLAKPPANGQLPALEFASSAAMDGRRDVLAHLKTAKETPFDFSRTYQFTFKVLVEAFMWGVPSRGPVDF